ncbi:MAG: uroporphyrinogen-III synthase [Flavobacteriales bacterium]|nr:uroporphyrinogen-III synthase [Flavobacteriales bacterium]
MLKNINILSTKTLEEVSINDLDGIAQITEFDILNIVPIEVERRKFFTNIIFTSYKAAQRGLEILGDEANEYHFFCVGKKTEEYLKEKGLEVYGFAFYSKDLADLIVTNLPMSSFTYMCGTDRLSNLPDILTEAGLTFEEVHTYNSEVNSEIPSGEFDVMMWFSPKGVEAFSNQLSESTIHVCIGQTTAKSASDKYPNHMVIYPEKPIMENMIRLVREEAIKLNQSKCVIKVSQEGYDKE